MTCIGVHHPRHTHRRQYFDLDLLTLISSCFNKCIPLGQPAHALVQDATTGCVWASHRLVPLAVLPAEIHRPLQQRGPGCLPRWASRRGPYRGRPHSWLLFISDPHKQARSRAAPQTTRIVVERCPTRAQGAPSPYHRGLVRGPDGLASTLPRTCTMALQVQGPLVAAFACPNACASPWEPSPHDSVMAAIPEHQTGSSQVRDYAPASEHRPGVEVLRHGLNSIPRE